MLWRQYGCVGGWRGKRNGVYSNKSFTVEASPVYLSWSSSYIQGKIPYFSFLYCLWLKTQFKWRTRMFFLELEQRNFSFNGVHNMPILKKILSSGENAEYWKDSSVPLVDVSQGPVPTSLWNRTLDKDGNVTLNTPSFEITLSLWNELLKLLTVKEIVHGWESKWTDMPDEPSGDVVVLIGGGKKSNLFSSNLSKLKMM